LDQAATVYRGTDGERSVDALAARLDEPLRVAIAGRVKAGKSTLLNALVGDELAPTDAGECTRIVTWYRYGQTYRVTMRPRSGPARQAPFTRSRGPLEVALDGVGADAVEELVVEWPAPALRDLTLIDTPGIGSLSAELSARSVTFLTPDAEGATTPSDAVIYLLRHVQGADIAFLEAFHDDWYAQPSPVNCIGVLGRADEMGSGRLDALSSARRIADRYSADPRLRRLVQRVVPVAGLVAQAGADLREKEFRELQALARLEPADRTAILLSADRFATTVIDDGPDRVERRALVERLGLFGVRLAVELLAEGRAATAAQLAASLVESSGIEDLRRVLLRQFRDRRDTLKARAVLLGLQRLLATVPAAGSADLAGRVEQVEAGAHELVELRLLDALRRGEVRLRPTESAELERLLGMDGGSVAARLGLPTDAPAEEVKRALLAAVTRWRQRAESPAWSPAATTAARAAVRTCEGLYAGQSAG
jgi:hypothetical protein